LLDKTNNIYLHNLTKSLLNMNYCKVVFTCIFLSLASIVCRGQMGQIVGTVRVDGILTELVTIAIDSDPVRGTLSEQDGTFRLVDVPYGSYEVTASYLGFEPKTSLVTINENQREVQLQLNVYESTFLNEVVVTGTKTFKRRTNSPVIVNVIDSKVLDNVQACNLFEGLKFQPGLRVQTDCQTCNYTQLRMNGLAGGYSQILINGRPIFSPLTGLYGLEQIPTNMIERIEVVRGGGSTLYGSSAIGGTVNVISKVPKTNSFELNSLYQSVGGRAGDIVLSGNASLVSDNEKSGVSFFFNNRNRDAYDHNADNFTELPNLKNTSFGTNLFFLPSEDEKLEISLSNMKEYRYGGEITDKPTYLAEQAEERDHDVWMGSVDYQKNFNGDNSSIILFGAWQDTDRGHYTGIFPDESQEVQAHIESPPFGTSSTTTIQGGVQVDHRVDKFLHGSNTFTFGTEYVVDDVYDEIPAYRYLVDQRTTDLGVFVQSDWEIVPSINLLSGMRVDKHNLVDDLIVSPRLSLFYKHNYNSQIRVNYGTGFRAPQAFDTDLHIAFAGGGVSRVILSPDLQSEKSQSLSTSINYDKPNDDWIVGFTLEGFYTRLNEAFILQPQGEDEFGELFEKQNGQGASVYGSTLELRGNYNKKLQLETGLTLQSSQFDEVVEYIPEIASTRDFIRTPNLYGYATLSYTPTKRLNVNMNYLYTGAMLVPHFAGAPNQIADEIYESSPFSDLSAKIGYTVSMKKMQSEIEIYGGVKNILNAYQNNFDIGKNRDSNFVFGPSLPRTFFLGVKLRS